MNALDRLCSAETCAEILASLTPGQLRIAAWRYSGLRSVEIAELFGVTPSCISVHLAFARLRVAQAVPEVMGDVLLRDGRAGRRSPRGAVQEERRCADCEKPISRRATRCKPCGQRKRRELERQ